MPATRTIYASAGAAEYRGIIITEITGQPLVGETCVIAFLPLGQNPGTSDWQSPDVLSNPTTSSVQAEMLIEAPVDAGRYKLWGLLTDVPEMVAMSSPETITVA